jgi:hypothetical protein
VSHLESKNFRYILKSANSESLDKSKLARIIHQIDQRCRDVHPRASEGLGGKTGLPDREIA